ncbi:hypothetical protein FNF29_07816 [Cafeteria roenbergensis]|nr:hypothetical protein FNF29_07816 [Cafeteria roenbergensis]|eukprot:KAA0146840.1 hypothetical protein FNF29_07816 [Cafeteria roenbergensis]
MASVMPDGAKWVKAAFEGVDPDANKVTLSDGRTVSYDFLVVAAGIDSKWDAIKGLPEALAANNGVSSNYSPTSVENTWKNIQALERGDALFTFPSTPIKCAGAPQKIMYLASEHFAKHGRPVNVEYFNALGKMFAVDKYAKELSGICDERSITRHFFHNLVEVDAVSKQATFAKLADGAPTGETVTRSFDMLHATPPMGPIKALADSPLANSAGWIDVNQETLQHTRYPNVFSLGDCSSIPTSKTAAAVAGQNGVLKANLRSVMTGMDPTQKYDGYTSCPLVTGRNSLILAEFSGFTGQPLETFPFDQGKPSAFGYWLKAEAMPTLYWEFLLKDRWHGVAKYRKALAFLKDPAHNVSSPA